MIFLDGDHIEEGDIMIHGDGDHSYHHFSNDDDNRKRADVTNGINYRKWNFPIHYYYRTVNSPDGRYNATSKE